MLLAHRQELLVWRKCHRRDFADALVLSDKLHFVRHDVAHSDVPPNRVHKSGLFMLLQEINTPRDVVVRGREYRAKSISDSE